MAIISLRFEDSLLREMKKAMKKNRYSTKTEFIREAVRDKIKDLEREEALIRLDKIYGASKRNTTYNKLKKAREEAFEEIAKEHGIKLN